MPKTRKGLWLHEKSDQTFYVRPLREFFDFLFFFDEGLAPVGGHDLIALENGGGGHGTED